MEEPLSKSQKKRDATALQKIGTNLIALTKAQLDKIPMPDFLRQAINDAQIIKTHEAKRRQAQLIGKLIRKSNHEEILQAYNLILAGDTAQKASFQRLELWRDKLLDGGNDTLAEFLTIHEGIDVQKLRQLIKKAIEEKNTGRPKGAAKALFRFMRDHREQPSEA